MNSSDFPGVNCGGYAPSTHEAQGTAPYAVADDNQPHGVGLITLICDCGPCIAAREAGDREEADEAAGEILSVIEEWGINREKIAEVFFTRMQKPHIESLDSPAPPFALTDQHAAALSRAIEAEGFRIMADLETGDVRIDIAKRPMETAPKDGAWVLLYGGCTQEGTDDDNRPVVAKWTETEYGEFGWSFAYFDGSWGYGQYEDPTHWSPVGGVKLERREKDAV